MLSGENEIEMKQNEIKVMNKVSPGQNETFHIIISSGNKQIVVQASSKS